MATFSDLGAQAQFYSNEFWSLAISQNALRLYAAIVLGSIVFLSVKWAARQQLHFYKALFELQEAAQVNLKQRGQKPKDQKRREKQWRVVVEPKIRDRIAPIEKTLIRGGVRLLLLGFVVPSCCLWLLFWRYGWFVPQGHAVTVAGVPVASPSVGQVVFVVLLQLTQGVEEASKILSIAIGRLGFPTTDISYNAADPIIGWVILAYRLFIGGFAAVMLRYVFAVAYLKINFVSSEKERYEKGLALRPDMVEAHPEPIAVLGG